MRVVAVRGGLQRFDAGRRRGSKRVVFSRHRREFALDSGAGAKQGSAAMGNPLAAELIRLGEEASRTQNWQRWGPYLAEREWGTVREDYSADGEAWRYFPHEHARSRAYRWGEDGLLGICDRECRLCFALALWNGRDPILKERLFGLTGPQGNHGEDVKECYFYLDSTPTHSWMRARYKYPQAAFPYEQLVAENQRRTRAQREYELSDTGVFDGERYFDVDVTYAKAAPDDICIEITVCNRGPDAAPLHVLPTLWFRNTWSWGATDDDDVTTKPTIRGVSDTRVRAEHPTLGAFWFDVEEAPERWLFTENETNAARLFGAANASPQVKDGFHAAVVEGRADAVNPERVGTKCAPHRVMTLAGGERRGLRFRLHAEDGAAKEDREEGGRFSGRGTEVQIARANSRPTPNEDAPASVRAPEMFGPAFTSILEARRREADEFYAEVEARAVTLRAGAATERGEGTAPTGESDESRGGGTPPAGEGNPRVGRPVPPGKTAATGGSESESEGEVRRVVRQAYAGLLWSKQFYHLVVRDWLAGDPAQPAPPAERKRGRNREWRHMFARDVISMPDKWEYPWFAAWDLAFHMVAMAPVDPNFAKHQLNLLLREWYLHPSGQMPAYEWNFSDVNPPVHAWACWRVYKMSAPRGSRDRGWLARVFQKLLLNFTWWVNRKDPDGNNVFSGGFLGLDNIGVFDRSRPLIGGGQLEQADGTAWMAFYCGTMLSMALELAEHDPVYEDIASKFFEHFVAIADAMNRLGGTGLWHEEDGFYYDQVWMDGRSTPLRLRSMVGIIPLFAVEVIDAEKMARLSGFSHRTRWFIQHRRDLAAQISYLERAGGSGAYLLAIPSRERLERMLRYVFDDAEFLARHGIRSLSRAYDGRTFTLRLNGEAWSATYAPGESDTGLFGGNSNWRGPIWFPANFLLIEALERYHHFYGDSLTVEFPTGSGHRLTLDVVARELAGRLVALFLPDANGRRPAMGTDARFATGGAWADLLWFHEYFHAETGEGLGASHQTGWTALVTRLAHVARAR
jgi:hypothetical protein